MFWERSEQWSHKGTKNSKNNNHQKKCSSAGIEETVDIVIYLLTMSLRFKWEPAGGAAALRVLKNFPACLAASALKCKRGRAILCPLCAVTDKSLAKSRAAAPEVGLAFHRPSLMFPDKRCSQTRQKLNEKVSVQPFPSFFPQVLMCCASCSEVD